MSKMLCNVLKITGEENAPPGCAPGLNCSKPNAADVAAINGTKRRYVYDGLACERPGNILGVFCTCVSKLFL